MIGIYLGEKDTFEKIQDNHSYKISYSIADYYALFYRFTRQGYKMAEKAGIRCLDMRNTEKLIKSGTQQFSDNQATVTFQRNRSEMRHIKRYVEQMEKEKVELQKKVKQKEKDLLCHILTTEVNPFLYKDKQQVRRGPPVQWTHSLDSAGLHLPRLAEHSRVGAEKTCRRPTMRSVDVLKNITDRLAKKTKRCQVRRKSTLMSIPEVGSFEGGIQQYSTQYDSSYKAEDYRKRNARFPVGYNKEDRADYEQLLKPAHHALTIPRLSPVKSRKNGWREKEATSKMEDKSKTTPRQPTAKCEFISNVHVPDSPQKIVESIVPNLPQHLCRRAEQKRREAAGPDKCMQRRLELLEENHTLLDQNALNDPRWKIFFKVLSDKPDHKVKSKMTKLEKKKSFKLEARQNMHLCFEEMRWVPM